jgi:hypothetical protein
MFNNYAAHVGVLTNGSRSLTATVTWNFNDVITLGYGTDTSNKEDRPRINFWRSDDQYVEYVSGGRDVLYPMSTGNITTPWGDRRNGSYTIKIPLTGDNSCGIDLFTHSYALPTALTPPLNEWITGLTLNPNETKYQYIFKPTESTKNLNIEINYTSPCSAPTIPTPVPGQQIVYSVETNNCPKFTLLDGFWIITNPMGKTLSNFKVNFNNGSVIAKWGENDTSQNTLISNTPVNHNFTS